MQGVTLLPDLWIVRGAFLLVFALLAYHSRPFGLEPVPAAVVGLLIGIAKSQNCMSYRPATTNARWQVMTGGC